MGKRYFQMTSAELAAGEQDTDNSNFSLDEGAGAATGDFRVVWDRGDGTQNLIDTTLAQLAERGAMTVTLSSGTNTGIVRVNYEDTHGTDAAMAALRVCREEIAARGNSIQNWFTSKAQYDLVLKCLKLVEQAFGSRGRHEAHVAAN